MNFSPGLRVAVVSADLKTFLGFGEYLGDFPHPALIQMYERAIQSHETIPVEDKAKLITAMKRDDAPFGRNPKIRLDDGREIWGAECWWGPAVAFIANGYAKKYGVTVPEVR